MKNVPVGDVLGGDVLGVVGRVHEGRPIFASEEDRRFFVERLGVVPGRTPCAPVPDRDRRRASRSIRRPDDSARGSGTEMEILIQLLIGGVFGTIVSILAVQRGRSGVGWFFVGFFAGCIGLILVLVLPDLKVQQERERRLASENRRLKEQIRKDRMVADQRHDEVKRRLTVHDRALGVDTGARPALPEAAPTRPAEPAPEERSWWYLSNDARLGPVGFDLLRTLWRSGGVDGGTLVWTTGMPEWVTIQTLPDLESALDA